MNTNYGGRVAWVVAAIALYWSSSKSADAALIVDLRVGDTPAAQGKTMVATSLGQTFNIQIFADVYGADSDGGNDGLQELFGSLVNVASGTTSTNIGPMSTGAGNVFSATHTSGGTFTVGANVNRGAVDGASAPNYIYDRAGSMQYNELQNAENVYNNDSSTPLPGTPISNSNGVGSEFYLGHATVTITSIGTNTTLNWRPRYQADGTPSPTGALWVEDAQFVLDSNGDPYFTSPALTAVTGTYEAGTPILIETTPEPASLTFLIVGGGFLLCQRKKLKPDCSKCRDL